MEILEIRELGPEDLAGLRQPNVKSIRANHHRTASLIARGLTDVEVGRLTNRSAPTIRNFRLNPANANLIAELAEAIDGEVLSEVDYRAQLIRYASTLAAETLADRLEAGLVESDRTLLAIMDSGNDRTGLGKMETKLNIHHSIGAQLDKAAKRLKAHRASLAPPKAETLAKQSDGSYGTLGLERRV